MMKISLLITTYNDPLRLRKTLIHYLKIKPQPAEILVCDDGSKADTKELVESFAKISRTPIIHIYQTDHGWNAPGIRNLGAATSSGDYLLMTDGDCIPHPKFIQDHLMAAEQGYFVFGDRAHVAQEHIDHFNTRMDVLINYVCLKKIIKRKSAIRFPYEQPKIHSKTDFTKIGPLANLSLASNFGVWKKDFMDVNGFDESFRLWWPEDAECAARLLNAGLKVKKFNNQCLVYHLDHGDSSRLCHEEHIFAENSLITGKLTTANGIRPSRP